MLECIKQHKKYASHRRHEDIIATRVAFQDIYEDLIKEHGDIINTGKAGSWIITSLDLLLTFERSHKELCEDN